MGGMLLKRKLVWVSTTNIFVSVLAFFSTTFHFISTKIIPKLYSFILFFLMGGGAFTMKIFYLHLLMY